MQIGCHLSSSKGYLEMGKCAVSIGATTFAFFTRNPRGGAAKEIKKDDVEAYLKYAEKHGIKKIVAHAPYTLNLCSANAKVRRFAREILIDDLKRMEYTPNQYYNFHPGSHGKQGIETGIEQISEALNLALKPEQTTTVLLETMAGKGTEVGRNFEELRAIIDRIGLKDKIGVCLDTCHIWDGGYDVVNNFNGVIEEFDKTIGLKYLCAVHLNDSMNPIGTHKDRHQKIGQGHIGLEAIIRIINHESLRDLPFILETPNALEGYAAEIALLRSNYKL